MAADDNTVAAWLARLAPGVPAEIDGETVTLTPRPGGAELSAVLYAPSNGERLNAALRLGFSSALHFDAGLRLSEDGNNLLLSQWLPGVTHWSQAAQPLETLLNQVAYWRLNLAPQPAANSGQSPRQRQELRMRMALAKGIP